MLYPVLIKPSITRFVGQRFLGEVLVELSSGIWLLTTSQNQEKPQKKNNI